MKTTSRKMWWAVLGVTVLAFCLPVTDDAVSWIQWSDEEAVLYYNLQDDVDAWWAFDAATGTSMSLPAKPVLTKPMPDSLAQLIPEGAERVSVSPDGASVVYAVELYTEPTPTPSDIGEGEGIDVQCDLYGLDDRNPTPVFLGRIDGSVDGFQWLPDEREVLILTSPRQPGTAFVWITDFEKHESRPLLIVEKGKDDPVFEALSPEGNLILYQQSSSLYLYNLENHTIQNVAVPEISGRAYFWFLSETQLLIVDDFDQPLDFKVAVYDLQSEKLLRISEQILRIHSVELSPSHKYLAIRWDGTLALYVFPICYDN